jgi:hypothetical protein
MVVQSLLTISQRMLPTQSRLAFFKAINRLGYSIVQLSELWSQTIKGLKFQKFTLIVTADVGGFRGPVTKTNGENT